VTDMLGEKKDHRYFLDGKEIPGVTTIIKKFWPYYSDNEQAMQAGTNIHQALLLSDKGELDADKTDQVYIPFLKGWERERVELRLQLLPFIAEEYIIDNIRMYGGTPDRRFYDELRNVITIVDFKTGQKDTKRDELQLYAYAALAEFEFKRLYKKQYEKNRPQIFIYDVYLSANGNHFHKQRVNSRANQGLFFSYLNVFNHMGGLNASKSV
jgi:hypothetical protein